MTVASVVSTNTAPFDSTTEQQGAQSSVSITPSTAVLSIDTGLVRIRSTVNSTGANDERASIRSIGQTPINKVYPHVFDGGLEAGQALSHIEQATRDAQQAIDAFGEPNLAAVAVHLGHVAIAMKSAFPLTYFNESLGGVVAFIRRATLSAPITDLSRSALNSLLFVLRSIVSDPMLDLDEGTDLIDKLSSEGWQGEHSSTQSLLTALLDQSDLDGESRQKLLFAEP